MLAPIQSIPVSLYVHLPWCVKKCPYCDFNSHALKQHLPESAYIQALCDDFQQDLTLPNRRALSSIFMGGGTPSLFSDTALANLFDYIKTHTDYVDNIEITLEANPGTVEIKYFSGYFDIGINRLSIGVQSFDDKKLQTLGRIHDAKQAKIAIEKIKKIGFTNFNIDIMYGLPEQTIDEALADLQQAIDLHPTHISWYQLTLEPNTLFAAKPPTLPNDDILWDMQHQGQALLAQHDYQQYEISAYAKPGRQCQHNMNYWQFGDYYGIGAGAHSKLTLAESNIIRQWKLKNPKDYLNSEKAFIGEQTPINAKNLIFEFMLNNLRLTQPISFDLFEQRTGLTRKKLIKLLAAPENDGLLTFNDKTIQKTELGFRFLNDLQAYFL